MPEVLLEQRHSFLYLYCLGQPCHYNSRFEQVQHRLYGQQSLKYLLSGPLQTKLFCRPVVEGVSGSAGFAFGGESGGGRGGVWGQTGWAGAQ